MVLSVDQRMLSSRTRAVILVADDDPVIRGNLAVLLHSEGYRVVEAADGVEAARHLADPDVALALLDLKMPGRGGMDVLRDHHDRLEEMPVIVITALGGSAAAIEAMKLGAYDYITKPFDLDEVLFTVRRALTQRSAGRAGASPVRRRGQRDEPRRTSWSAERRPCCRCSRRSAGWRRRRSRC